MSEIVLFRIFVAFLGYFEILVAIVIAVAIIFAESSPSIRLESGSSVLVSVRVDGDPGLDVGSGQVVKASLTGHGRVRELTVTRASVPETRLTLDFPKGVSPDRISVTVSDAAALPVVPTPNRTPISPPSRP